MKGINNVHLVGALAIAPELRYTPKGRPWLELTFAGIIPVETAKGVIDLSFYQRVKAFGKRTEKLAQELAQGDVVAVDGSLEFRSWEGEKGRRSTVEVYCKHINKLDPEYFTLVSDARGQPRLSEAVNEVTLGGNLTRDTELSYTPSGDAVASFSVAVNEVDGDRERAGFYQVDAWRALAEAYGHTPKGAGIIAKGRINNGSYEGRDGKVFTTSIEATHIYAVAPRGEAPDATRQMPSPPAQDEEFPPEADLPF